jgi:hypothetical protein
MGLNCNEVFPKVIHDEMKRNYANLILGTMPTQRTIPSVSDFIIVVVVMMTITLTCWFILQELFSRIGALMTMSRLTDSQALSISLTWAQGTMDWYHG